MAGQILKRGCIAAAGIFCLAALIWLNRVKKTDLYETAGQTFERAEVLRILTDNKTENENAVGSQKVVLKILTGEYKGDELEAYSASSHLFGADCKEGMHVIAIVNSSENEITASVYGADRALAVFFMVFLFFFTLCLVGGKRGAASVAGLILAAACIVFVFLPLIYRGVSPILAAVFVVVITTAATICLVGGTTAKSIAAICGTAGGVAAAGMYAWLFGKVTHISGYNVSEIEELVYVAGQTKIRVGGLLFAGILIAALGAVMDVGMSIAATQQEILEKRPELTAKELFASGMNVGKDMMGTMSNTLILAFAGGSVNTLVCLYAYNYPVLQLMNMYSLGIEIMQGVSATMGVVLTVPLTSAAGAVLLTGNVRKRG